jgi:hypothetical protein
MKEEDSFLEAKNALLSDYSSRQTDQVARLIGFSVALFTLLEAVRGSRQQPLSGAFSTISSAIPNVFAGISWLAELVKLILLFASIWGLIFLIVRAVIRFSLFSHYVTNIISVKQEDIRKISRNELLKGIIIDKINPDESLHLQIIKLAQGKKAYEIEKVHTKLFLFVPLSWFFNSKIESTASTKWQGWLFYVASSFLITLLLMWFLW